ncbi:putative amine sulfotransferase-like [Apostichopus japonicus]|uniref:Putative amine sulfotransferase-like n=1 Tax=Stichopus japonicus TaxID=307972 RepID=A0A2G8JUM8_STIJA|nr:putative amine sulfotransferase-like [Apostichopus japonicus]
METLNPFLVYKGRYHVPAEFTTKQFIEEFEDMEVRHDDIFIATYPKSGNYVLRHPKDVFVSYYNFVLQRLERMKGKPVPRTQEMFDAFFDDLIGGRARYGDWFDNVIGYYEHRHDVNFLFVHFESMKSEHLINGSTFSHLNKMKDLTTFIVER